MRPQGKWNLGESSAIAFATGQYVFVMAGRDPAIHAVQMPQISPARAANNRWTPRSGCVPSRMDGRDKHGWQPSTRRASGPSWWWWRRCALLDLGCCDHLNAGELPHVQRPGLPTTSL